MHSGQEIELSAVVGAEDSDGGVEHGRELLAYTEAVMSGEAGAIASTRDRLQEKIGAAGIADTAAVIAMFNVVDRIADATGIPLDAFTKEGRIAIAEELGIAHLSREDGAR